MEARILKLDGTLGKKIYTIGVPADVRAIRKRLNKTVVGVGKWRNTEIPFFTVFSSGMYAPYFSMELLQEIIAWMKNVKEDET